MGLPSVETANQMLSPRATGAARKKVRGGGGGVGGGAAVAESHSGPIEPGPPFRSQSDRRQWLLSEKKKWLVQMRLGGQEMAAAQAGAQSKLPPILSNGMDVNTVATPRF